MEKQTKLIFKRKIPASTPNNHKSNNSNVYLPYLVLEKLHGYMSKKSFKMLSSTCKYYRNFYSKEMNKYWFEMYSRKYDKKNVEEKHGSKVTCECSTYLKEAHMKQIKARSLECHKQLEEMQKQYKADRYKKVDPQIFPKPDKYTVYKLQDFQKVIKSDGDDNTTIKWLQGVLIKYCKNKKHIIYEYNYENYDKNHNYFLRYLNAKQEKEYLSRYDKFLGSSGKELKLCKEVIRGAEQQIISLNRQIEQYQKSIVEINNRINQANANHTKIIEKGWDVEFYPTVTSIAKNLSK